jgi:hypothetical protein
MSDTIELGHAGMDDSIQLRVGDVMPECQLVLRADGTCEHGGYFLDPVGLHLVLGVDVSPWHERAIIDACRVDDPGEDGTEVLLNGTKRRQWVWSLMTQEAVPTIGLMLFVRPGEIRLPEVRWHVAYDTQPLCTDCAIGTSTEAMLTCLELMRDPGKGMRSTLILVGRDHKVLGISRPACHGDLAIVWQRQLADALNRLLMPEEPRAELWSHPVGQPEMMDPLELERYLVANGWIESVQKRAARIRRAGR